MSSRIVIDHPVDPRDHVRFASALVSIGTDVIAGPAVGNGEDADARAVALPGRPGVSPAVSGLPCIQPCHGLIVLALSSCCIGSFCLNFEEDMSLIYIFLQLIDRSRIADISFPDLLSYDQCGTLACVHVGTRGNPLRVCQGHHNAAGADLPILRKRGVLSSGACDLLARLPSLARSLVPMGIHHVQTIQAYLFVVMNRRYK